MVVGFISVSPSEVTGNSSGKPPASYTPALDLLGQDPQMGVARIQVRPCVADPDHRSSIEHLFGMALVLGPSLGTRNPGATRRQTTRHCGASFYRLSWHFSNVHLHILGTCLAKLTRGERNRSPLVSRLDWMAALHRHFSPRVLSPPPGPFPHFPQKTRAPQRQFSPRPFRARPHPKRPRRFADTPP